MNSKTAEWFEIKFKYDKTDNDGLCKVVTETYCVDAVSFSDAEKRIMEKMESYVRGETFIKDISRATYKEVLFSEQESDDKFYKVKAALVEINEKNGKEKYTNIYYLVQASSTTTADRYIHDFIESSINDYIICDIKETPIIDVFTV